ncbi:MAG: 7-cyano-7-deazaguanine synthase QueC [Bacteroidota bacterium]|nr:7-cyano-7-deazaguanine synthase QueC [Bacteroidota bacterium]
MTFPSLSAKTNSDPPIAVVLVSGGMDSCVTAAVAARDHRLALLHADYGQRTRLREFQAFTDIANHYNVPQDMRLVISLEHFSRIGGSSLTDHSRPVPPANDRRENVPDTYVPFRNAHLLAAGVSWAEVIGAESVFIGAVEEDSSGYPDCKGSFFEAFQQVVRTGTKWERPLHIVTPLLRLSKADIVRMGIALRAPLEKTWSCYTNEDLACGICESCVLRLRGFHRAGMPDPIPYARYPDTSLLR